MGIAIINKKECHFDDTDLALNVHIQDGNVIINGKVAYHGKATDDLVIEVLDIKGRKFTFSNVGVPKEAITKSKAKAAIAKPELMNDLMDDFKREGRNLRRKGIRKGLGFIIDSMINGNKKDK